MKQKIFYYISILTIITAVALIFTLIYWLVKPYKVADFYNMPFHIVNENATVKRGDRLRYEVNYCKYREQMPQIIKFFIDGVVYETPKSFGVVDKGCGIVISDVYVPKAIPAGVYTLKIVASYKLNPIRTVEIVNRTQKFTVID